LGEKKMKNSLNIGLADLQPILDAHAGTRTFKKDLAGIGDRAELVLALAHYIQFNSVFGSGVANLAGEIASRQDLFRDTDEEVDLVADRSVEVAAQVFFAAIDEFGGHAKGQRGNHRGLAQATLKAIASYFNISPAFLNKSTEADEDTLSAIEAVRNGYGLNQALEEPKLFRAMGFHIGSEVLADEEFNVLDGFLRANYPGLVEYLKKTKVAISGAANPAYAWIQIHTSVEADHFQAAVSSANLALHYYAGYQTQTCIKNWILDGFREFATVQSEFMKRLVVGNNCFDAKLASRAC
jgi:hypothetical protein